MNLIKNQTLITELDKYRVDREIYNSICDQMNWPVDEIKVQYKAIRNLLRFTKYGRRWAYDTPVLKEKITVPGFLPTMLGFDVYLTKAHVSQYITGLYELTETMLLSRLSPYFKRFIDVGANVGYFSFLMAGAGKEVVAFEPTTETYGYLTKGIEKNNLKITAHKYAVGEKHGMQDLYLIEGTGQNSLCNVTENKETVEVVPLDEFAGPDTLIKIDIENYEEYALRGMKNWIESADRPIF